MPQSDFNNTEWLDQTEPAKVVQVEIRFSIMRTYYFGDPNDWDQIQSGAFREPIYQPRLELKNGWLLSSAVEEDISELISYYKDVVRLHEKHGHEAEVGYSYFWINPVVPFANDRHISFPIYDTWKRAVYLFDSLENLEDRELFDDIDQGWCFQAFREGESIKVRDSDWERGIEHSAVEFPRDPLLNEVAATRRRGEEILSELRHQVGRDYWSERELKY